MTRTFTAPAAAVAVALSLLLGGCFMIPQIPDFTGGDGSSQDNGDNGGSSDNGDSSDIEDNPFLDHEVPDTFPADIPLPDLDIVFSLDLGTGWSIIYRSDNVDSDYESIASEFESAGWESLMTSDSDEGRFGVFSNDEYQVQVVATYESSDYDGPILSYTVAAKN